MATSATATPGLQAAAHVQETHRLNKREEHQPNSLAAGRALSPRQQTAGALLKLNTSRGARLQRRRPARVLGRHPQCWGGQQLQITQREIAGEAVVGQKQKQQLSFQSPAQSSGTMASFFGGSRLRSLAARRREARSRWLRRLRRRCAATTTHSAVSSFLAGEQSEFDFFFVLPAEGGRE